MKLFLIAPGYQPFPPQGWGAVESIVWDYYENLKKKNIDVTIINNLDLQSVINQCNASNPDAIYIMYDDYIVIAPYLYCNKIFYMSHFAYLTHPRFKHNFHDYYNNIFMEVIRNKNKVIVNAISPQIQQLYIDAGHDGTVNLIHNGAREDLFNYTTTPSKPHKSIYIAKIENRKCQYKYQSIPNIDFVGNYQDTPFDRRKSNYLGEWSKNTLYNNLTNYGNLVLLSRGEADPLVVKEALIAGLGVVVSECASANLERSLEFITIIPNDKLDDINYVRQKIEENREISVSCREDIRNYALQNFSWDKITDKFIELCLK